MITMSENGPIPDIDKCLSEDAMWLYFSSWGDLVASQNTTSHIQDVFAHQKVITLDEVTSLNQHKTPKNTKLDIYPNPARSVINIRADQPLRNPEIDIYDSRGRNVRHMKIDDSHPSSAITINISALVPGIYKVLLHNGATALSDTLVVY
jgi:mannan endo-1,4-beta-mannosidase